MAVHVDSSHQSDGHAAPLGCSAAASSVHHAELSDAGLLVAMRVMSSPDELPRILGVLYSREGLRALPRLRLVCSLWRDTLGDVVRRCGGLSLPAHGAVAPFGVMAPTYPLALADGTVAVGDVGPLRTRGETSHGRVRLLSPRGVPQRAIGIDYPRGLASDGDHLYVVNSVRDTVLMVRLSDGKVLATASGDGRMFGLEGVAHSEGSLYVADVGRGRILVFDTSPVLRYRRAYGGSGATRGQFNRPTGVAARGGEVYVADTANHRVQVISGAEGTCLRVFGAAAGSEAAPGQDPLGTRAGEFVLPRGVALDAAGTRLFVAEQKRVQVISSLSGMPLQVLALPGAGTLWGLCVSEQPDDSHVLVVDNFRQAVIVIELCDAGVSW